jgi:hypothetical protein
MVEITEVIIHHLDGKIEEHSKLLNSEFSVYETGIGVKIFITKMYAVYIHPTQVKRIELKYCEVE